MPFDFYDSWLIYPVGHDLRTKSSLAHFHYRSTSQGLRLQILQVGQVPDLVLQTGLTKPSESDDIGKALKEYRDKWDTGRIDFRGGREEDGGVGFVYDDLMTLVDEAHNGWTDGAVLSAQWPPFAVSTGTIDLIPFPIMCRFILRSIKAWHGSSTGVPILPTTGKFWSA